MSSPLLVRQHRIEDCVSEAVYSPCETYRYSLTRTWDESGRKLLFVMLNPSTADELRNDPTVERCERRARSLGFGAFRVTNIFAFRATSPTDLKKAKHPEGADNDEILESAISWSDQIIAAWGVHGHHQKQDEKIKALLFKSNVRVTHLGLTKDGHPRHPLYVPYSQSPVAWQT